MMTEWLICLITMGHTVVLCWIDHWIHVMCLPTLTLICLLLLGIFYLNDKYMKIKRKYFGNSPISANTIFYIDIPPEKALGRIKQRARIGEESIPIEFLQKLQNEYEEYLTFAEQCVPVYKSKQKEDTMSQLMTFINSLCIHIGFTVDIYVPVYNQYNQE